MHSQRKVGGSLGIPKASSYLHILQRNLLSGWLHIKWNFWLLAGSLITEASYQFPRDSWPRVPSNSLLLFSNQGVGPGFLRESVLTMQRTSPGGTSRAVNKVKEIRGRKEKPVRSVVFKTGDKKKNPRFRPPAGLRGSTSSFEEKNPLSLASCPYGLFFMSLLCFLLLLWYSLFMGTKRATPLLVLLAPFACLLWSSSTSQLHPPLWPANVFLLLGFQQCFQQKGPQKEQERVHLQIGWGEKSPRPLKGLEILPRILPFLWYLVANRLKTKVDRSLLFLYVIFFFFGFRIVPIGASVSSHVVCIITFF